MHYICSGVLFFNYRIFRLWPLCISIDYPDTLMSCPNNSYFALCRVNNHTLCLFICLERYSLEAVLKLGFWSKVIITENGGIFPNFITGSFICYIYISYEMPIIHMLTIGRYCQYVSQCHGEKYYFDSNSQCKKRCAKKKILYFSCIKNNEG